MCERSVVRLVFLFLLVWFDKEAGFVFFFVFGFEFELLRVVFV